MKVAQIFSLEGLHLESLYSPGTSDSLSIVKPRSLSMPSYKL